MAVMRIKQHCYMGEQDSSVLFVTTTLTKAKIHGNGWEPQLTWEPVLWAQVSFQKTSSLAFFGYILVLSPLHPGSVTKS